MVLNSTRQFGQSRPSFSSWPSPTDHWWPIPLVEEVNDSVSKSVDDIDCREVDREGSSVPSRLLWRSGVFLCDEMFGRGLAGAGGGGEDGSNEEHTDVAESSVSEPEEECSEEGDIEEEPVKQCSSACFASSASLWSDCRQTMQ
ncbi:hypothetical protein TYRP_015772 [Tyrophagus putrescentiae]|nr:hypothetical protein TYRP_015772 [Tyrophagus putrescentiae]